MNTTPAPALATPDAAPPREGTRLTAITALISVLVFVAVSCAIAAITIKAAAVTFGAELHAVRVELAESKAIAEEQLVAIQTIDILTPPTNDKLFTILAKGIGHAEDKVRTDTVSTTPKAAFATDLTTAQRTDAYTQEIVIQNIDVTTPADNLCIGEVAWSGVTTCTALCAASGLTCSAASTDGVHTTAWQRRYDGTTCLCVVGSAAVVNYQSERVLR